MVSQKVKYRIIIQLSNFTALYVFKRTKIKDLSRYLYNYVHNTQGVKGDQVFVDRRMDKRQCAHTIRTYSALDRKEILTHATT